MWGHSSFIAGITEHFTADYKVTHAGNDMSCQSEVKLQAGFWAHPEDEKNSGNEWHMKHQTCPSSHWHKGRLSEISTEDVFYLLEHKMGTHDTQCAPNTPFQISFWSDLCIKRAGAPAPILQVTSYTSGMMNWKSLSLARAESFKLHHEVTVMQRSWKIPAPGPLF